MSYCNLHRQMRGACSKCEKEKLDEIKELLDECIEHLEWCNYGDSYESECAEKLKNKWRDTKMANGEGCRCSAYYSGECACGVDWTDGRVYDLARKVRVLEGKLRSIQAAAIPDPYDVRKQDISLEWLIKQIHYYTKPLEKHCSQPCRWVTGEHAHQQGCQKCIRCGDIK